MLSSNGFSKFERVTFAIPALSSVVKSLIVINTVIFLLITLLKLNVLHALGLVPVSVIHKFTFWQVFSYMFVHIELGHFLINMLMLWMFGTGLEEVWGARRFLSYYFLTGVGAALCSIAVTPSSAIPIVGASGALFGLLVAYAYLFPDQRVWVFFLFPMKIRYAVMLFAAINLWGAFSNQSAGIAYIAHLGGALTGWLYLKEGHIWRRWRKQRVTRQEKKKVPFLKQEISEDLDSRVNAILDKITTEGMDALTAEDKKVLEKKRQQLHYKDKKV